MVPSFTDTSRHMQLASGLHAASEPVKLLKTVSPWAPTKQPPDTVKGSRSSGCG